MAIAVIPISMTYAEYLAAEEKSVVKHEYLRGEVFAMSGGTLEHGALMMAFGRLLQNALEGKRCRTYSSDVRVRIVATGLTTYPDISVACGNAETEPQDPHSLLNPILVVEVLSDSTEAYDRGAKAVHYRQIPSLAEYVLVSQREQRIEVQRRNAQGHFEIHEWRAGETVHLTSVDVHIAVDAIYLNPLA